MGESTKQTEPSPEVSYDDLDLSILTDDLSSDDLVSVSNLEADTERQLNILDTDYIDESKKYGFQIIENIPDIQVCI